MKVEKNGNTLRTTDHHKIARSPTSAKILSAMHWIAKLDRWTPLEPRSVPCSGEPIRTVRRSRIRVGCCEMGPKIMHKSSSETNRPMGISEMPKVSTTLHNAPKKACLVICAPVRIVATRTAYTRPDRSEISDRLALVSP